MKLIKVFTNCFFIFVFVFFLITTSVSALTIKLGSLAPKGTLWYLCLQKLNAEWSRISNKEVTLKIYSGGSVGDESDMLRKIRLGKLNAAAVTGPGLSLIFPGALSIQIPQLVRTEDEFKYLLKKMKPMFDKEFEKKGFKVLLWTHTGWVYLFSRYPAILPNDLKKQKLAVSANDMDEATAWKKMGYLPVPVKTIDSVIQIQTGGIDALTTSPFYIFSCDIYNITNNMNTLKWAPFIGAMVIKNKTWNKIPKDLRKKLEDAADMISESMEDEWIKKEKDAILNMQKYGLVVHDISEETKIEWQNIINTAFMNFVGNRFDIKFYNQALKYLTDYRKVNEK